MVTKKCIRKPWLYPRWLLLTCVEIFPIPTLVKLHDADIDLFGVHENGESDNDSDGEEEDNDEAVGDGQYSIRRALAC
jgi:hypothetical protein